MSHFCLSTHSHTSIKQTYQLNSKQRACRQIDNLPARHGNSNSNLLIFAVRKLKRNGLYLRSCKSSKPKPKPKPKPKHTTIRPDVKELSSTKPRAMTPALQQCSHNVELSSGCGTLAQTSLPRSSNLVNPNGFLNPFIFLPTKPHSSYEFTDEC